MSIPLDPKLILEYLNELGYTGITSIQLKEFMRDLKKLIKYELRQAELLDNQENVENYYRKQAKAKAKYDSLNNDISESHQKDLRESQANNIFESLHKTNTAASQAKNVPKKDKIITVQIKRPTKTCTSKTEKLHIDEYPQAEKKDDKLSDLSSQHTDTQLSEALNSLNIEKPEGSFCKTKAKSCTTVKSKDRRTESELRPKSSFIRPRIPIRTVKSDPVALYHHYQEQWKRMKIPGEDNRAALRWVVREKMMGGDCRVASAPLDSRKSSRF